MAIVIEQFEFVVGPPQSPQPQAAEPASRAEQTQLLRPDEIVTVMQVHEERLQRVRAD